MFYSKNYLRILQLILVYRKTLYWGVCAMVLMALAIPLLPLLINQGLSGEVFLNQDQDPTGVFLLALVGLVSILSVVSYISLYVVKKICANVCMDLRVAMFEKLFVSTTSQLKLNQYNLSARFIRDINLATGTVMRVFTFLVRDVLAVIGLTVCMIYLNWELALFIILMVFIVILITLFVRDHLKTNNHAVTHTFDTLTENIEYLIQQFRVIRLNSGQSNAYVQLKKKAEQIRAAELKWAPMYALIVTVGQLIAGLVVMAVVIWVTQMVYHHDVTVAELCALGITVLLIIMPLRNIFRVSHLLRQGQGAVDSIFSILDQEIKQDSGVLATDKLSGSLVLEQVCVYSGIHKKPRLVDVDLAIKPGEVTAIVNMADNERQVLIDLILGFCSPSMGKIQFDGYNIETIKQSQLHDCMSVISFDEELLDETIAANIAYGAMHASSESEIVAVAHVALAMDFIREMPDGLQTRVGEGGQQLTQIQIQQLAIARTLLKKPKLLILNDVPDHAVSAMDQIFQALNTLMQGRSTLIFTTHQLILERANRILVFDNGCVVETGTHQELISQQGKYAQIVQARSEVNGVSSVTL